MFDASSPMMLSIPRPQHGLVPFQVDLTLAYEGESRLKEIATAGSGNAMHLASVFSRAYDSLGRAYGALHNEVALATIDSRKRRAVIILDLAPNIVKEKGLAGPRSPNGSEDVREAICYQDEPYCAIEQYRAGLEAAKELVFLKLRAMNMAFEAVKSVVRGTSGTAGNRVNDLGEHSPERSLLDRAMDRIGVSGGVELPEVLPESEPEPEERPAPARRGFGTPSYR